MQLRLEHMHDGAHGCLERRHFAADNQRTVKTVHENDLDLGRLDRRIGTDNRALARPSAPLCSPTAPSFR